MALIGEEFSVSAISNVVYYEPKSQKQFKYPGKLPTFELMYYVKGDTEINFNGKMIHMTKGDLLYLPKGIENDEYTVNVKEDFAVFNVYFYSKFPLPDEAIKISAVSDSFKNIYEKLYKTWIEKREGYYYKSMQYFYSLLELVYKNQNQYRPRTKHLFGVEDYIAENYLKKDFDYDKLLEISGLSYSYFKKVFIQKYGYPPVKYITSLRIDRAKELLITGNFSVSDVAKMCGFENVYYFSNVFKKITGVSPKNYIRGE